jgi:hypothetical protein
MTEKLDIIQYQAPTLGGSLRNILYDNAIIRSADNTELMCILKSSLLDKYAENWSNNRQINQDKVNEITNIIRSKQILDTVLQCFFIEDKLIVFDGGHRLKSLKSLYNYDKLDINVMCYIYIYSTDKIDKINKIITEKFNILNESTPISNIDYDVANNIDNAINKSKIIDGVLSEYKNKYKLFYKITNNCRKPHFNDTKFKNLCSQLEFNTIIELDKELNEKNEKNKKEYLLTSKLNTAQRNKCEKDNFFLFI